MATPNHSQAERYPDWYLRLRGIVSIIPSWIPNFTLLKLLTSVCIISIIRLIVLSRLYDVDVTCKT